MRASTCVLVIGVWSAALSAAASDEPARVRAEQSKQDDSSRLICTREVVTGSNMKRKVCRTRAQIEQQAQSSQEAMSDITSTSRQAEGS